MKERDKRYTQKGNRKEVIVVSWKKVKKM